MTGYTVFVSYVLIPTGNTGGGGYKQPIHCNYVKKIAIKESNPDTVEINLVFSDIEDFKFLSEDNIAAGSGYSMNEIHGLVQIVDNSAFSSLDDVKPDSTAWKDYNMTNQITSGYVGALTPTNLTQQVFKIPLYEYDDFLNYNLSYLDYPLSNQEDELSFGDITYFFGNLTTKIKADVYTTNISVELPLNEFNSSTNSTWNGNEKVYISEIGIYDSNNNLVGIGKLNHPVPKDPTISRTIIFAIDF